MDAREDPRGATDPEVETPRASAVGVGVGFIGAGNVLGAYLRVLDLLIPKGVACEGPVFARDRSAWDDLRRRRPGIRLVATAGIVGIGTALGAILDAGDLAGWIVGLVVALISVLLAAVLWRSRTL